MDTKSNATVAVLFLHHMKSDVVMHNYELLKKFNKDVSIFPVGFEWHDLIDGSHVVRRTDELPNNYVLNKILNTGTSSESDLLIYDFFLYHQDFSSYFVFEWDTYCNCSIKDYFKDGMEMDTFSAQTFPNETVKNWSWYGFLSDSQKMMPNIGGTYPTSGLYYKRHVLTGMLDLLLNNPRVYDNIQNEMRLGTLIQQAGYKLKECGGDTIQFYEMTHYRPNIKSGVKGYYHPIKTIL